MSDIHPDAAGATQEPASSSPKSILVIGGQSLQRAISPKYVDFCGCDFVSILEFQNFGDYKAVIYWPDETALELPGKSSVWNRLKLANPQWPKINPNYWVPVDIRQRPQKKAATTGGRGKLTIELLPLTSQKEAELLWMQRHERTLCYPRLRTLLSHVTHGQMVICVAPARLPNEDPFRWLAPSLFIEAENNRKVEAQFASNPSANGAYQLLSAITKSIGSWGCNFTLLVWDTFFAREPVEDTWQGLLEMQETISGGLYCDAYRGDGLADFLDQAVTIQAGHLSHDERIKSIVFTSGSGGLVLIPEPQTPAKLVEAIRDFLSSSSKAKCKTCGWRHDSDFNYMATGQQEFKLNPAQAAFVKKLHDGLERGDSMLPSKDNLVGYPTVLELFKNSPNGVHTCKAIIERRYGLAGLRTA